jgi:hypothetical protein
VRLSKKVLVFIFTSLVWPIFFSQASCPVGDLNGDCRVDFNDMQLFAEQWLGPVGSPADLNSDEEVGFDDFTFLAQNWQKVGLPLYINEVMASNSKTITDPQVQYDDWIEIHNAGSQSIDIGGMYLTNDTEVPTKWRIPTNNPAATLMSSNQYLLIWADDDTTDVGLHANFRLDAAGDQVYLFDKDGKTLIDSVVFGNQDPDISYGRWS